MAYNEQLASRIVEHLFLQKIEFTEKKMFGGIAFMINEKMCIGVMKNVIMLRVLENHYDMLLEENYVKPMEFTGKTMKGFLFIEEPAFAKDVDLNKWIVFAQEFGEKGIVKTKKK
jgi:TfoX/Sxy family transcriptional regulator of competence genes